MLHSLWWDFSVCSEILRRCREFSWSGNSFSVTVRVYGVCQVLPVRSDIFGFLKILIRFFWVSIEILKRCREFSWLGKNFFVLGEIFRSFTKFCLLWWPDIFRILKVLIRFFWVSSEILKRCRELFWSDNNFFVLARVFEVSRVLLLSPDIFGFLWIPNIFFRVSSEILRRCREFPWSDKNVSVPVRFSRVCQHLWKIFWSLNFFVAGRYDGVC